MWEIFFFKNHAKNEVGRLIPDLFLFFEEPLCKVKASGQHLLVLIYFSRPQLGHTITFQTVDPEICLVPVFYKRSLPPHFVYDFSRKMFLMLCFINRPNFIIWLSLLLVLLGNMCIVIQSRLAMVWNSHFVIFSFRASSFSEEIFWNQLTIHSPEYHNIMSTKCKH